MPNHRLKSLDIEKRMQIFQATTRPVKARMSAPLRHHLTASQQIISTLFLLNVVYGIVVDTTMTIKTAKSDVQNNDSKLSVRRMSARRSAGFPLRLHRALQKSKHPLGKPAGKDAMLRSICERLPKQLSNIADVRVGTVVMNDAKTGLPYHQIVPASCVLDEEECLEEAKEMLDFVNTKQTPHKVQMQEIIKSREKVFSEWEAAFSSGLPTLTSEQDDIFKSIFQQIKELKLMDLITIELAQGKPGKCGEYAARSIKTLLEYKLKYGMEVKIQRVTVTSSELLQAGHAYVWLDSNKESIKIEKNAKAVKRFLNSAKAKVCDEWNQGYYADLHPDDIHFYGSEAGWDSLQVETISLNFAKFNTLPLAAQKLICGELKSMGLDVEPAPSTCQLFQERVTKSKTPHHVKKAHHKQARVF